VPAFPRNAALASGGIQAGCSAIVEVYPALWSRSFHKTGCTGDQHDAFSIAWLSRTDRDGSLAPFLKPELTRTAKARFGCAP
jgi:hypothetical protein